MSSFGDISDLSMVLREGCGFELRSEYLMRKMLAEDAQLWYLCVATFVDEGPCNLVAHQMARPDSFESAGSAAELAVELPVKAS